jgi:L-cysteine S-thiosulfotransferase
VATRARPQTPSLRAPLLLALLLTGGAAGALRAESDWVESAFPPKQVQTEKARQPPGSPSRLVKSANRSASDREAVKNRDRERRQAAEAETERQAKLRKKSQIAVKPAVPAMNDVVVAIPPATAPPSGQASSTSAPADRTPQASAATDTNAPRMRLGVPPVDVPATAAIDSGTPRVQPSGLPVSGIAPPPETKPELRPVAAATSQMSPSDPEATSAAPQQAASLPADATPDRASTKLRDASAAPTVSLTAALARPAKSFSPAPALDSQEPEARMAAITRGQRLWLQRRGPRQVSLEECDLGLGPGRVVGTFSHLPRYFADANRVMDLETRVAWCARTQQDVGLETMLKPRAVDGVMASEMEDLAVYVASLSASWRLSPPLTHVKEQQAVDVGHALYSRRQGPLDFSCATCHGAGRPGSGDGHSPAVPQTIRFWRGHPVPQFGATVESQPAIGNWPAWRAAHGGIQTLQGRLATCFSHMGVEPPTAGSDAVIALVAYLTRQAEKGEVLAPGRKR